MSVKLLAIAFNHDPNSATHDALNIRKDNDEFVIVPEWRRGATLRPRDSVAAYAIEETRGRTITIRAKFSTDESGLRTVEARAIQPPSPRLPFLGTLGTFLPWPYAYYYD